MHFSLVYLRNIGPLCNTCLMHFSIAELGYCQSVLITCWCERTENTSATHDWFPKISFLVRLYFPMIVSPLLTDTHSSRSWLCSLRSVSRQHRPRSAHHLTVLTWTSRHSCTTKRPTINLSFLTTQIWMPWQVTMVWPLVYLQTREKKTNQQTNKPPICSLIIKSCCDHLS